MQKKCKSCKIENCKTCNIPGICKTCLDYYFESSGSCQKCPKNCLKCEFNSDLKCTKCQKGYKIDAGKCVGEEDNSLTIIKSTYSDTPSRVRIEFDQKISASITTSNTKLELRALTKTQVKEGIQIESIFFILEENEKFIRIHFRPKSASIEEGVLKITLLEKDLIRAKENTSIIYSKKYIEIPGIRFFTPEKEIKAANTTSKVASYSLSLLGLIGFIGSSPSFFEVIKSFQMVEFLVYLNVKHPSNLHYFLENLELQFIEKLPNPFKFFKGDKCSIDKEKFVEDNITCYILSDQGRYIIFNAIIIAVFIFFKILTKFVQSKKLKTIVKRRFGLTFWVDLLEAIRLDLFISMTLSITKIGVLSQSHFSLYTANLVAAMLFAALNIVSTTLIILKNEQKFSGFRLREKIKTEENEIIVKHFRLECGSIDLDDPEETIKKIIEKSSGSRERKRPIGPVLNLMKRKFEHQVRGLPEDPYSEFNKNTKTEHFYQRNHKPLTAVKDLIISLILVGAYDSPVLQTLGATLSLGLFVTLDFYYQPSKEKSDNIDTLFTSTVFFLLCMSISSLSVVETLMSRVMVYYAIGYTSILLILLLMIRNIFLAVFGIHGFLVGAYAECSKSRKRAQIVAKSKALVPTSQNQRLSQARNPLAEPNESIISLRQSEAMGSQVKDKADRKAKNDLFEHPFDLDPKNVPDFEQKKRSGRGRGYQQRSPREGSSRARSNFLANRTSSIGIGGVPELLERKRKRQKGKKKKV